ncbi:MAG: hypothetical protein ACXACW_16425 [Candidatus Hodarchaeales archaeon]|jgi:hypothetical protein
MLIEYNPDEWEAVIEHDTCNFHKEHPEQTYPGCTCFSSYSQRRKDSNRPHPSPIPKIEICSECGTALGCEE